MVTQVVAFVRRRQAVTSDKTALLETINYDMVLEGNDKVLSGKGHDITNLITPTACIYHPGNFCLLIDM